MKKQSPKKTPNPAERTNKLVPSDNSRSAIMRAVKGKHTVPERIVRSALHRQGFRFRLHNDTLPGKPDIALPRYKAIIRVMGCFWHGHQCKRGNRTPKNNQDYWTAKITRNAERDKIQKLALQEQGWRVIDLWECDLKGEDWISALITRITS